MANITVSASRNLDDIANAALTNGATITINSGAVLTMNSDTRWSQRAAVPLSITIDASGGGELVMDGRDVWWLPYTAGSGTVPVLGTTFPASNVTSATASGEFLGVFTGLGVAPSSGTMPATGFIKLRAKTGGFANAQALSLPGGATATASGAGQRGWLNIVGAETGSITIPRLGKWTARGDWYDLATTSGSRDQTIQYFVADYCPALWIETSAGSGVYEIWLNAGARWSATYVSMDARGKFFGCTAAGVITLAATGFGKLPASGCKIRVPNIHISNTTSANYALNTLNGTMSSRWKATTLASGSVDISGIAGCFYFNCQTPYSFSLADSALLHGLYLAAPATPVAIDNLAIGLASTFDICPLWLVNMINGGLIQNTSAIKYSINSTTNSGCYLNTGADLTLNNVFSGGFARLGVSGAGFSINGPYSGLTLDGCAAFGGQVNGTGARDLLIKNLQHTDTVIGGVITTNAQATVALTLSNPSMVDGVAMMTDGTPSYNGIVDPCPGMKIRNIGTPSARYDLAGHGNAAVLAIQPNVKVQRVYVTNSRTGISTYGSNVSGVLFESVWGDALDTLPNSMAELIIKGGYGGSAAFNAAGGINTNHTSLFGSHFYDTFISDTQGRVGLYFNEPSIATAANAQTTAGVVEFNATGGALLKDIGDQLTYTWPHFILGYTSLANVAPAINGANTGNLTIEYDLDKGSGFSGTWQTCNAANLSAETGISATTGFKPKFRFTCATASISNSINGFYITGTTDSTSQQTQYPLDTAQVSVDGLVTGSRVKATRVDNGALLFNGLESGGAVSFSTDYIGLIEVEARKASSAPYYRPWASRLTTVSGSTVSATAIQILD